MRISPCLNVVLLATVAWLALRDHSPVNRAQTTSQSPTFESNRVEHPSTAVRHVTNRNVPPFRWAQLESTNYLQYIANLRAIGCPELTIHDLITAELRDYYATQAGDIAQTGISTHKRMTAGRRDQLEMFSATRNTTDIPAQAEAVADQLLGLQNNSESTNHEQPEPGSKVATLTAGGSPKTDHPRESVSANPNAIGRTPSLLIEPVRIPQSLKSVDPADMRLSAFQQSVIDELKNTFAQDISTGSGDPNDPAYQALWRRAQRKNDDLLAGRLGRDFYVAFGTYSHAHFDSSGKVVFY